MYGNILVPLDGSLLAENILPYARRLALAGKSEITLLFVANVRGRDVLPMVERKDRPSPVTPETYLEEQVQAVESEGIGAQYAIVAGPVPDSIREFSLRHHNDLIALATHGRAGLDRLLHRGTADELLRTTRVPLLLIRSEEPQPSSARLGIITRIIVPLDGTDVAEAALPHAVSIAKGLAAQITLVRAISPAAVAVAGPGEPFAYGPDPGQLDLLEGEALDYVTEKASELTARALTVDTRVMIGPPALIITDLADETGSSLVVMSTRGRSGFMRLVLGSVTNQVVSQSRRPVLLIHPPAG